MKTINKRPLRAFVRYDGRRRIISGSLILRRKMPRGGGNWVEIPAYQCCSPSDITCVEYSLFIGDETIELWYTGCDGSINGPIEMVGPSETYFCARRSTIAVTGSPLVTEIGLCENSTSTTTTTEYPN